MATRSVTRWASYRRCGLKPVPGWFLTLRNRRISYSTNPSNDAVRFAYRRSL